MRTASSKTPGRGQKNASPFDINGEDLDVSGFLEVGAAQIASKTGDLAANFQKHHDFMERAASMGVDLLVFPELSLVGHYGAEALLDVVMTRDDPRLLELSRAAGEMECPSSDSLGL
jgi:hypothetical protein